MSSDAIKKGLEAFTAYLESQQLDKKKYQFAGVKWCLKNELGDRSNVFGIRGGFIADEMGLGKTIMMIGTFIGNPLSHTLIVLPPILIDQWYLQIRRTTGHKALIYHAENKKTISFIDLRNAPIVITTYGALTISKSAFEAGFAKGEAPMATAQRECPLFKIKWSRAVFDEAHHLRNKTACHRSVNLLNAKIRWLVSGTPVQNRGSDFHNLCAVLRIPSLFYSDPSNLRLLLSSFLLKRSKKDVGIQLPSLILVQNVVNWQSCEEMTLSKEIHSALTCTGGSIMQGAIADIVHDGGHLSAFIRAKQMCIWPSLLLPMLEKSDPTIHHQLLHKYKDALSSASKLKSVVDRILQRKHNGNGKLVFCNFRREIDEIRRRLESGGMTSVDTFDGRVSNKRRNEILSQRKDVLILQIQTGCEGLNLQEHYSEIYFVSPHWNPSIEDQAIARCHRIGQTKPVLVEKFVMSSHFEAPDAAVTSVVEVLEEDTSAAADISVETYMRHVQKDKRKMVCAMLDVDKKSRCCKKSKYC